MGLEPYQIARELMAGSLLIINVYWFIAFARETKLSWSWIMRDRAALAALSLAIYFFGAIIARGWDYAIFFLSNLSVTHDYPTADWLLWLARESWPVVIFSGGVMICGGLVMVRAFMRRDQWPGWSSGVAVVSILVPILIYMLVHR